MNAEEGQNSANLQVDSTQAYKQLEDCIRALCTSFEIPEKLIGAPVLEENVIRPIASAIDAWEMATVSADEEMVDVTRIIREMLEANGIPNIVLANIANSLMDASRENHVKARVALQKKVDAQNKSGEKKKDYRVGVIENGVELTTEQVMLNLHHQG